MAQRIKLWEIPSIQKLGKEKERLSAAMLLPEEDLMGELKRRQGEEKNKFPMHIFPPSIHPWLSFLLLGMKAEPSFVGTALMQACSVGIGSGLRSRMSTMTEKLSIYSALVGYTSSGKSVVIDNMMEPIKEKQRELDKQNEEAKYDRDKGSMDFMKKAVITEDTTYGAFVELLMQNPKGVSKVYDELSTFFDDMERFKTVNAGEDKFWLKAWNSNAEHRQSRKTKGDMMIPRETFFCNIFGGTQPIFLKLFFQKNRYESGFSSRFLFALQPVYEIMEIDPFLEFPTDAYNIYRNMIHVMYETYRPGEHGAEPDVARFEKRGIEVFQIWSQKHLKAIRGEKDEMVKNAKAGIYGKMKQYVVRFACLLKAMYQSLDNPEFSKFQVIEMDYVRWACRLADYYIVANYTAYQMVNKNLIVPPEIIEFVGACKAHSWNISKVAEAYNHDRKTIRARINSYSKIYPHLFFSKSS
jgi:hypothetical protein